MNNKLKTSIFAGAIAIGALGMTSALSSESLARFLKNMARTIPWAAQLKRASRPSHARPTKEKRVGAPNPATHLAARRVSHAEPTPSSRPRGAHAHAEPTPAEAALPRATNAGEHPASGCLK